MEHGQTRERFRLNTEKRERGVHLPFSDAQAFSWQNVVFQSEEMISFILSSTQKEEDELLMERYVDNLHPSREEEDYLPESAADEHLAISFQHCSVSSLTNHD